jgi:membrane fusion protein, multidrug efflux system
MWVFPLIAIVGFASWRIFFRPAPEPPVSVAEIRSREGTPVTVFRAELLPWEHWITFYGKIVPATEVSIAAERQEYVSSVSVDVGASVGKGQVLATLDSSTARERLSAQEAVAIEMESKYNRLKALQAAGGASAQEVESAFSAAQNARAGLKDLQTSFSRLRISSPISGVVTSRNVEKGNFVSPGQVLFRVADLAVLDIVLDVAPNEVGRITAKMPSRFRTPAGWVYAEIKRIEPLADPATGLFSIVLSAPSGSGVSAGQTIEAQIRDEREPTALMVPYEAIRQLGGDRVVVYVLSEEGTAVEKDVTVGNTSNGKVRILSGLDQGDQVIVKGSDRLFPNARVWVQEE